MAKQTKEDLCKLITPILSQRRQASYYNILPPRLEIISPYPLYTNHQLNMRRKVEILKYSNSQQNTKTNNPTKKQHFANLVRNTGVSATKVSQYSINQQSNLVCLTDKMTPTLTTASDVPGPPMILKYEPDVPLYNYGNFMSNRSYASVTPEIDAVYNFYTENIVELVGGNIYSLIPDEVFQNDVDANYTYTGTLGSLVIRDNPISSVYNFNITTPISIWFNSSIKSTIPNGDLYNNKATLPSTNNVFLTIHINSVQMLVYYNDTVVKQVTVVNDSNSITFVDTICNLNSVNSVFYAIQYVGMLRINNLSLDTPPRTTYTFKYVVSYSYNSNTVNTYLDFIQTGVYANLESAFHPEYLRNCITSTARDPVRFSTSTFTKFNAS
jgi:hypothetical protein